MEGNIRNASKDAGRDEKETKKDVEKEKRGSAEHDKEDGEKKRKEEEEKKREAEEERRYVYIMAGGCATELNLYFIFHHMEIATKRYLFCLSSYLSFSLSLPFFIFFFFCICFSFFLSSSVSLPP